MELGQTGISPFPFLFDKCELFGYELNNWYTKEDELYVVIVERSFDV